jgi:hypothetical protein
MIQRGNVNLKCVVPVQRPNSTLVPAELFIIFFILFIFFVNQINFQSMKTEAQHKSHNKMNEWYAFKWDIDDDDKKKAFRHSHATTYK